MHKVVSLYCRPTWVLGTWCGQLAVRNNGGTTEYNYKSVGHWNQQFKQQGKLGGQAQKNPVMQIKGLKSWNQCSRILHFGLASLPTLAYWGTFWGRGSSAVCIFERGWSKTKRDGGSDYPGTASHGWQGCFMTKAPTEPTVGSLCSNPHFWYLEVLCNWALCKDRTISSGCSFTRKLQMESKSREWHWYTLIIDGSTIKISLVAKLFATWNFY